MKTKFKSIDVDGSGWISRVELKKWSLDSGYGFSEEQIDDLCYSMDSSGNGKVNIDEFIQGMVCSKSRLRLECCVSTVANSTITCTITLYSGSRQGRKFIFRNQWRTLHPEAS